MTPLVADARQRLTQHQALLERALDAHLAGEKTMQELAETRAAIERIEQGTYGRCQTCMGAIGRQRLLALPTTRFCIGCAPQGTRDSAE